METIAIKLENFKLDLDCISLISRSKGNPNCVDNGFIYDIQSLI